MSDPAPAVPRWEWRVFGNEFPTIEARIRATSHDLGLTRVIHLLGGRHDVSVALRHKRLDVKALLRSEDGLEYWEPFLDVDFPIDAETVRSVFTRCGVGSASLARPAYDIDRFLAEVVPLRPSLRVVSVAETGRGARLNGVMVETASLHVLGRRLQTVALHSEDAAAVRRALYSLGLAGLENTNYVKAFTRLLGTVPQADRRDPK